MTRCLFIFLLTVSVYTFAYPQGDDKVDVFIKVSNSESNSACREFTMGKPVQSVTPEYPAEARSRRMGGAVRVEVLVSKLGRVSEILSISGDEILSVSAREAALKTSFTLSRCDNVPVEVKSLLVFNFVPFALSDVYVVPERADRFADVGPQSPYYEPVLSLKQNYKLAFGYADGMFHPEALLTRGDFAHFLRLTLDLLQAQAEISKKIPREIDLYFPYNSLELKSSADIVDLDTRKPYYDSVGFLISKYDVALANNKREFNGDLPFLFNDVVEVWGAIFGGDAVPVNFAKTDDPSRIMTRGEFALFLHESLYVLTYKVLP